MNKVWAGMAVFSTLLPIIWVLVYICDFGQECLDTGRFISREQLFNWHPFLMVTTFAFFIANAVMSWRILPRMSHKSRKTVHGLLNTVGVALSALGFWTIYEWKGRVNKGHFTDAHQWLGMFTLTCLWLQWLAGFFVMAMPGANRLKASMAPLHRWGGRYVYIAGITTIALGVLNLQRYQIGDIGQYSRIVLFAHSFPIVLLMSLFMVLHQVEKEYMPFPVDYPPVKGQAVGRHDGHHEIASTGVGSTVRTPDHIIVTPQAAQAAVY